MWSPIKLMGLAPFLANFGWTHPLNPQVLFFIMRHTFCLRILLMTSSSSMKEIIFIDSRHLGHNKGST